MSAQISIIDKKSKNDLAKMQFDRYEEIEARILSATSELQRTEIIEIIKDENINDPDIERLIKNILEKHQLFEKALKASPTDTIRKYVDNPSGTKLQIKFLPDKTIRFFERFESKGLVIDDTFLNKDINDFFSLQYDDGWFDKTLIVLACEAEAEAEDEVRILLEHGANPNPIVKIPAIVIAIKRSLPRITRLLLDAGASLSVGFTVKFQDMPEPNEKQFSPVDFCMQQCMPIKDGILQLGPANAEDKPTIVKDVLATLYQQTFGSLTTQERSIAKTSIKIADNTPIAIAYLIMQYARPSFSEFFLRANDGFKEKLIPIAKDAYEKRLIQQKKEAELKNAKNQSATALSTVEVLSKRLEELATMVKTQEDKIQTLTQTVTSQGKEITALKDMRHSPANKLAISQGKGQIQVQRRNSNP